MAFRPLEQILAMRAPGSVSLFSSVTRNAGIFSPTDAVTARSSPSGTRLKAQAMNFGKVLRGGTLIKAGSARRIGLNPVMRCPRRPASAIAGARGDAALRFPEKVEALREPGDFYVADYPS